MSKHIIENLVERATVAFSHLSHNDFYFWTKSSDTSRLCIYYVQHFHLKWSEVISVFIINELWKIYSRKTNKIFDIAVKTYEIWNQICVWRAKTDALTTQYNGYYYSFVLFHIDCNNTRNTLIRVQNWL